MVSEDLWCKMSVYALSSCGLRTCDIIYNNCDRGVSNIARN